MYMCFYIAILVFSKVVLGNPSLRTADDVQEAADRIREGVIKKNRALLDKQLDILHQATHLDNTHYQYIVLAGIENVIIEKD